ncbi:MAG: urea ABC transporter ATP-binding subunit UrtE [Actinobacteria bacterium]|nr:urea ABC transporter ATP-binding subunit UrtE [Actinomycetota bacterium]
MLRIDDLHAGYGSTKVLSGIDLAAPDAVTSIMGRNGVGKTTLLKAVLGLVTVWHGTITFDDTDLGGLQPYQRVRLGMGYVPQGQAVFSDLTVRENLTVVAESAGRDATVAVSEALEVFPRLEKLLTWRAGVLSGGQRQQLAIARALVRRPRLLVLDEPTEGIQPSIVDEIEDALRRLRGHRGTSVLVVEQYVDFALRLSDQYAVMDAGRIVAQGRTREVDAETVNDLLVV